jgi:probable HAF family extracellular repeat protein
MKSRITNYIVVMTILAALAAPMRLIAQDNPAYDKRQPRYSVTVLGTLGGTFSTAQGINNSGWLTGDANLAGDQTEHATVWRHGVITDLGTLGGPNSDALNDAHGRGLIVGVAQTSNLDPFGEIFVPYDCTPSGGLCQGVQNQSLGFIWQNGAMTALPTLGGNNSWALNANNRGQVVGTAENSTQDPSCIAPQVLDWEAVVWGPKQGQIQELPPFPGDPVGAALAINDSSQVVGGSGICESPSPAPFVHALLWQNGSVTDLGSLGGAMNNLAYAINNRGQVVGGSDLAGDITQHAFLWRDGVMSDLGTLPGDFSSFAYAINNAGQVVGQSCDASGNCRAFLWQDGSMTDLNTLIPPGSSLFLLVGNDINEGGEIAAQALDQSNGEVLAVWAIPCSGEQAGCNDGAVGPEVARGEASDHPKVLLPDNVRHQLRQRLGLGQFGTPTSGVSSPSSSPADQQDLSCAETKGETADASFQSGNCVVNPYTGKLTGHCIAGHFLHCSGGLSPWCPVGAAVKNPGWVQCTVFGRATEFDRDRGCEFR